MSLTESSLEDEIVTYDSPTVSVGQDDLLSLLRENERLRKQVDELQAAASKTANNSRARRVRAFHAKFGHPIRHQPTIPPDDEVRFRLKLIAEEFVELIDACLDQSFNEDSDGSKWREFFQEAAINVDLPALADALEDLDYVVEGARAIFGIHGEPLAAEVQRANMEKDAVYVQEKDGFKMGKCIKPVKPPHWTPPDIDGCLREQGWNPHVR